MELETRYRTAEKLLQSDLFRFLCMQFESSHTFPDLEVVCRRLGRISKMMDEPQTFPFRFHKYYRNHIFPPEIEHKESVFFGADINLIDAILIDMDPRPNHHIAHRGRYAHATRFSPH